MTPTETTLPKIPPPTGFGTCDKFESRMITYLVQHVQFMESGGNAAQSPGLMIAYGLAVARQIFATERRHDLQLFDDIADAVPMVYVSDVSARVKALSKRMRGRLLAESGNARETRLAQQVILEGGNP